ncbi:MAG: hypothetical protein HY315_08870, partial [Acidobacteria bacterium]|nr:hypothetical protein [Acidobacteriota bacterium]
MPKTALVAATVSLILAAAWVLSQTPATPGDLAAREKHLKNLRQLTRGGENAEAYFDFQGSRLVFQS